MNRDFIVYCKDCKVRLPSRLLLLGPRIIALLTLFIIEWELFLHMYLSRLRAYLSNTNNTTFGNSDNSALLKSCLSNSWRFSPRNKLASNLLLWIISSFVFCNKPLNLRLPFYERQKKLVVRSGYFERFDIWWVLWDHAARCFLCMI